MVISSAEIEGVRGLPFDCRGVAIKLQNVVKVVESRCGDNNILQKFSMRYCREVIKPLNKN